MAIIKDIMTSQGITATYSRLLKAEFRADLAVDALQVLCTVAIYATAEARDAGRDFITLQTVSIPFSALTQDPRDLLYPMLTNYYPSFLRGGAPDATDSSAPGNMELVLTTTATQPPAPGG
jgi:hypothetical protein